MRPVSERWFVIYGYPLTELLSAEIQDLAYSDKRKLKYVLDSLEVRSLKPKAPNRKNSCSYLTLEPRQLSIEIRISLSQPLIIWQRKQQKLTPRSLWASFHGSNPFKPPDYYRTYQHLTTRSNNSLFESSIQYLLAGCLIMMVGRVIS
ncbi:hypothetical protein ACTXT7_001858 [Hymenolepis weldensis]